MNMGPTGAIGHDGVDGSSFEDRMKRYVALEGYRGENISYGCNDPKEVIVDLAIDDGVSNRGHRTNIFNENYKLVGCFTGFHKAHNTSTVLNYNGRYTEEERKMANMKPGVNMDGG